MRPYVKTVFIVLTLLAVASLCVYSYLTHGLIYDLTTSDMEAFIARIREFGHWSALVLFALVILEVVLAPIPPLVLYIAAGILFGTLPGGLLVLLGNIAGALIAFQLARTIARDRIQRLVDEKARQRFDTFTAKYGPLAIFLLRINPLTSSDLFSYLAGLSEMKPLHFTLATALGLTPIVFLQTWLGADIVQSSPVFMTVFIVVSLLYLLLFVLALMRVAIKRARLRKACQPPLS